MSSWEKVGGWLKDNAGTGAALVGSLLTGNAPAAIAAGISLVSSATGQNDPEKALEALKTDPQTLVRLKELAYQEKQDVRRHIESMERSRLEDEQSKHRTTQETIRAGDAAADERIRWVRPEMAQQSWKATVAYCFACFLYRAFSGVEVFDLLVAGILSGPAFAYHGLRTWDKRNLAKFTGNSKPTS